MPRTTKTNAEQIEKIKTEIRRNENRIKKLLRRNINAERNMRTHRLIERGAILEKMIKEADTLTNEQIKRLLITAFKDNETVRDIAVTFRAKNAARTAEQNAEADAPEAE
jgi:hypothetical protein